MTRIETPTDRARAARVKQSSDAEKQRLDADRLHFDVFTTPEGQKLLAHFRAHTIDRRIAPSADGALRDLEAQRNFVRDIEGAIARYREHLANRKK